MSRRRRHYLRLLAAAAGMATLLAPAAAHAAEPMPLQVTRVDASDHPIVRVGITGGEYPATGEVRALTLLEDGAPNTTGNVYVGRLGQRRQARDSVVMLAIDSSLSMRGGRLEEAMRAAGSILGHLHGTDRVGVMTFGADTRVLLQPTNDLGQARRVLGRTPEMTYGTALYDAIGRTARELPADPTKHRVLIVLTDGIDVDSTMSMNAAADAIRDSGIELVAVGVGQDDDGATALARLVERADGTTYAVDGDADLRALYDVIGIELLRSHWVEFNSMRPAGTPIRLTLDVAGQDPVEAAMFAPPGPPARDPVPASALPTPVEADSSALAIPAGSWSPYLVTLPFGLALALGWLALARARRMRGLRELVHDASNAPGAPPPPRRARRRRNPTESRPAAGPGALSRLVARSPLGPGVERTLLQARVQLSIEQLAAACAVLATGAALLSYARWELVPPSIGAALGAALLVPLFLRLVARRRRREFERQLPDALGAVCSALRTGHGFEQALAAMTEDAPEPTASEFRRALDQSRLGRPIEAALESTSERWQSSEFEFVATTVSIQRQVGGSLAEVLDIVATTLRDRLVFRRKVQALTSMGRMSAWVLVGLPFVIAAGVSALNPTFLVPLFTTSTGHLLLTISAVSITIGGLLCRRIVSIDV